MPKKVHLKNETISVNDTRREIKLYKMVSPSGSSWYSAEVWLGSDDIIILDSQNLFTLKSTVEAVLPISMYIRARIDSSSEEKKLPAKNIF